MELIIAVGLGVNLFTLFLLFKNGRENVQANAIAIAIVMLWTLRFAISYLRTQGYFIPYLFHQYLFLLDGVLLWLYSKSLVSHVRFSFKIVLHFFPFLIGIGGVAFWLLVTPEEEVMRVYLKAQQDYLTNTPVSATGLMVFSSFRALLLIFYFWQSLREIRQYNQVLFANFSNLRHLSAFWLVNFLRLWLILFLLPLVIYFLNYFFPLIDRQVASYSVASLLLVFSFLFNSNVISQSYLPASLKEKGKSHKDSVPDKELDSKLQKLKDILSKEKYYEDENLSLFKLAGYMDIKPVDLSALIKSSEYNNFYDLINSYRIEAIKQDLVSTNEQIIVIAYNNGFNSKSAFNRIFKDSTGQTPSDYRKTHK